MTGKENCRNCKSNTLQRTATHCNTLQHKKKIAEIANRTHCNTLQHTATHCNTLQHTATQKMNSRNCKLNTLQHTATHCNTLQHKKKLQKLQIEHIATHCNTLQYTATHCNTLQHNKKIAETANRSVECDSHRLDNAWFSHAWSWRLRFFLLCMWRFFKLGHVPMFFEWMRMNLLRRSCLGCLTEAHVLRHK